MANCTNKEFSQIHQHINYHDEVEEYLSKANALIKIALHDDFLDYPDKVIHDYLWALSDMLEKAYECRVRNQREDY